MKSLVRLHNYGKREFGCGKCKLIQLFMSILDLRGHSNILILIDYKNQTISKANFLFYTDKKLSQILHIPKHYKLDHSVFVVALKKKFKKKKLWHESNLLQNKIIYVQIYNLLKIFLFFLKTLIKICGVQIGRITPRNGAAEFS